MTNTIKILSIAATGLLSSFAVNANAQDRSVLSARTSVSPRTVTAKENRTDDRGRLLKAWRDQHVYRRVNNTNVYQSEGQGSTRHDEVSSYAILFHKTPGQPIKHGHVYHKRGN